MTTTLTHDMATVVHVRDSTTSFHFTSAQYGFGLMIQTRSPRHTGEGIHHPGKPPAGATPWHFCLHY